MKEVKFKDFIADWKNIIVESGIYAYQIGKAIINALERVPWKHIHPYLVLLMFIGIVWHYNNVITINNEYISELHKENALVNKYLDSVQTDCEYNTLEIKAGEYAMHPHKEKSAITKDSVASLLIELDAWYPDIIMSQIEIESGFGTSQLSKQSNNILGMRKTTSRRTTQIKGHYYNGYGAYNNWESCVIDRVLWDHAHFGSHKPTRAQYVNTINNTYAEATSYGTKINSNSKKYRDMF